MSRETIFKDGAWVGGYEYSSATQLKEDIAKCEEEITRYREQFLALAVSTPRQIMHNIVKNGGNPYEEIRLLFWELWDDMQEATIRLANLYTIQLNEDKVEGY